MINLKIKRNLLKNQLISYFKIINEDDKITTFDISLVTN